MAIIAAIFTGFGDVVAIFTVFFVGNQSIAAKRGGTIFPQAGRIANGARSLAVKAGFESVVSVVAFLPVLAV